MFNVCSLSLLSNNMDIVEKEPLERDSPSQVE